MQEWEKQLLNDFEQEIKGLKATRAFRIQEWLASKHTLAKIITTAYDMLFSHGNSPEILDRTPKLIVNDEKKKIISICHPKWQGVRSASEGQSPNVLFLPEASKELIHNTVNMLIKFSPTHIILNGFWLGYDDFAVAIKEKMPKTMIFYVHHGSFYQFHEDRSMPKVVSKMIELSRKGIIERIGFVKDGMANIFNHFGIKAYHVPNMLTFNHCPLKKNSKRPLRIFIAATDHLRKNFHTQLLAAFLLEDVDEIHIIGRPDLSYLKESNAPLKKIIRHYELSRKEVLELIQQSTLVLYVTISECAPMVPLECFYFGIPCITGANHGLLKNEPFLNKMLTVEHEDDPNFIYKGILRTLNNYKKIQEKISEFMDKYDKESQKIFNSFLMK